MGKGIYKPEKDLAPLMEAVSWIPLRQRVRQWEDEDCYGILYYGMREWRDREGIRILNTDGTESLPPEEEHSFDISLNDWGEVRFVSCMPMRNPGSNIDPLADVSFYLLSDGQIVYRFPYVNVREGDTYKEEDNIRQWGLIDGISFVTFTDVNGDEKKDVVIGILYYTGAGPQGAIPRMEVRIYEDQGDEFVYDEELCSEYYGLPYDATAAEVKTLLKNSQQNY